MNFYLCFPRLSNYLGETMYETSAHDETAWGRAGLTLLAQIKLHFLTCRETLHGMT